MPDTILVAPKILAKQPIFLVFITPKLAAIESDLTPLAPDKSFRKGFYYTLSLIKNELKKFRFSGKKVPSLTTQFVVGAGEEKDQDIIRTTYSLYKNFGLKRVFLLCFSAGS